MRSFANASSEHTLPARELNGKEKGCHGAESARPDRGSAHSDLSARSVARPHDRRSCARHGPDRIHRPADRRRRRRSGSHGARQRLFRRDDAFRRDDRRQNGADFLRPRRVGNRQSHRFHGRADGSRPGGSHRALAFPLRRKDGRLRAFRRGLQPRLRFARAGTESRCTWKTSMQHMLDDWDPDEVVCSWKINRRIGEYLVEARQGTRHSEVVLRTQCARVRSRIHRFRAGHRLRPASASAQKAGPLASALRSLRRFRALRRARCSPPSAWEF